MLSHLLECRRRMLHIAACFLVLFAAFFWMSPYLFHALLSPLFTVLSAPDPLIATHLTTPLLTPLSLALDAALLGTAPFALLQIWLFASPGLYVGERHQLSGAIVCSFVLFVLGVVFGFYIVLPYMFACFVHAVPLGVRLMPDMGLAVDFITRMLLIFGLSFQIPLVCVLLVRMRLLDRITLCQGRPYVIVGAFIIGMLLTPPDVLSQIMLAVPLCLLYELGIVLVRLGDHVKLRESPTS